MSKNARQRLSKKTPVKNLNIKSKEAALQHTTEKEEKATDARKMLYFSSSDNKKRHNNWQKHSKILVNYEGIQRTICIPRENVVRNYHIDFMNRKHQNHSQKLSEPSCSYTHPSSHNILQLKTIMKSTPKDDKIVNQIWKKQQPA